MSRLLFCTEANTIRLPSGDHRGALVKPAENDVSGNRFEPSRSAT